MNVGFILIQFIGLFAWFMIIASYYRKDTDRILVFQIIATILYSIHYAFLGAWSGVFTCLCEAIFDYGYYKTDKDNYIYIISIPIRIIGGLIGYASVIDILPICASLIDGYSLTKEKKSVVVFAIITYSLWVVYDVCVMSYSGAITSGLIVLSNLSILLFGYNIFNIYEKKQKNKCDLCNKVK